MSYEYDRANASAMQSALSVGLATNRAPETPLTDEAGRALANAEVLHNILGDLEDRLFGPQPRGIAGADASTRPSLADNIRAARQRLDGGIDRLQSILARL
jgi:hypothetical protein